MKVSYKEEIFKRLIEYPSWKNEIDCFTKVIGSNDWVILSKTGAPQVRHQKISKAKSASKKDPLTKLKKLISSAKKTHKVQEKISINGNSTYCIPIIRGDQIYGYLGILNLKTKIPAKFSDLFNAFTCATIESVQKELELMKMSETIRPRTIALSTIHTVNRIISSTLEIEELLPRIARLSLQVLRARRCTIMLVDKNKRLLIPHAVVDVQQKKPKQEPLKIGKGLPGQVVKYGKTIIRNKYLCVPFVAEENIIGAISVSYRLDNKPFNIFDKEILTTLAEQAVIAIKNAQLYEEQEKLALNSIKALASVLSSGVAFNYGRSNLFINVTMSIGMELKLRSDEMRILYYAALLHNVSQMSLPEKLLKKSTKLTGKDYKIIRSHPLIGAQIIKPIGGRLKSVLPIIIYHHERYDGKGYPSGLKADEIPLGARILMVADAFEAMLSKRPYRKKLTISQAVSEIVRFSGEQFDPVIVDAFVRVIKRFKTKIFRTGKNAWVWKNL
ncbi:MAG: HD domain-containing protein [PVC group bacterium]|nr:HD domain-containing protein [PVC group bacterium]